MSNYTGATITSILELIYNATAWTSIAQNGVSPATNFYFSLHNADPGTGGNQTTNETAYTNYVREAVARTTAGFTVSGSAPLINVSNTGIVTFPQCGATGDTITHFGIGLASSGVGTLLISGPVGVTPAGPYGFTCTNASPGSLTVPGSSLAVNDRVSVYADASGVLPTGITEGTVYYVGTVTGIAVTLSTTASNANPVNTTSVGAGYLIKQTTPLIVSNGVAPNFGAGALVAYMS